MPTRTLLPILLGLLCTTCSVAQSLTVSYVGEPDTLGLSTVELSVLPKAVVIDMPSLSAGSDTLVVQLGSSSGEYDLFERNFPLSQTGTFADGCSLVFASGATVGLGSFTGLSTFYVRAYLTSSGVGSAVMFDNE